MTVGYLLGTFDLLNVGDLDLIQQVSASSSRLVLAVYTDELVTSCVGRPPVVPLHERVALLDHVRGVDEVMVFGTAELPDHGLFAAEDDQVATGSVSRLRHRESSSAMLRDALSRAGSVSGSEDVA